MNYKLLKCRVGMLLFSGSLLAYMPVYGQDIQKNEGVEINWLNGNRPPEPTTGIQDENVRVGNTRELELSPMFIDPDGDPLTYSFRVIEETGRAQLSIEGNLLIMTGLTPGELNLEVTADDGREGCASNSFLVKVNANVPPEFVVKPADRVIQSYAGSQSIERLRARDIDSDPIFYKMNAAPTWVLMQEPGGNVVNLVVTPPYGTKGDYLVRVTAYDGQGGEAVLNMIVRVFDGNKNRWKLNIPVRFLLR